MPITTLPPTAPSTLAPSSVAGAMPITTLPPTAPSTLAPSSVAGAGVTAPASPQGLFSEAPALGGRLLESRARAFDAQPTPAASTPLGIRAAARGTLAEPHQEIHLTEPVAVALDENLRAGAIHLEIPLSALDPAPMTRAELAKAIDHLELPMPWQWDEAAEPRFEVRGSGNSLRLAIDFDGAVPDAWRQVPAQLGVFLRSGQFCILSLRAPALDLDLSAPDRAGIQTMLTQARRSVAALQSTLAEARARAADPDGALPPEDATLVRLRAQLADDTRALTLRGEELDARIAAFSRPELQLALLVLSNPAPEVERPNLRAAAEELHAASSELRRAEERKADLERVLAAFQGVFPGRTLPPTMQANADEVAALTAALPGLTGRVEATEASARAATQEPALQTELRDVASTFQRGHSDYKNQVRGVSSLGDLVERLGAQHQRDVAAARADLPRRVACFEDAVATQARHVADLEARLAAPPLRRRVPVRYGGEVG